MAIVTVKVTVCIDYNVEGILPPAEGEMDELRRRTAASVSDALMTADVTSVGDDLDLDSGALAVVIDYDVTAEGECYD